MNQNDTDDFQAMNYPSKQTDKFIRKNLDRHMFKQTNRISLNQFLSLFNVIGVNNAKKL